MYTKNLVALAAVAGLAEQALAFNSHRHLHRAADAAAADKRDMVTHWVTVYETAFVTEGGKQDSKPAATNYVVNNAPPAPSPAPQKAAPPPPPPAAPTTLLTSAKPVVNAQVSHPPPPPPPVKEQVAPTPAAASPSKAAAPSAGGNGGSSKSSLTSKRGIAYNDPGMANIFGGTCKACSWAYNWGSNPGSLNKNLNFIPTLWGDRPAFTANWDADAEKAIANGAKALFSFNECDNGGQANMPPTTAAAAHAKYMSKYAGRVPIGAPSITNSGNPHEGVEWLKEFMAACDGSSKCPVDFCNVHWYSPAEYADTLFTHLEAAHKACGGRPLWLTEFAPTAGDEGSFLKKVIPKLESLDYLHGYSYFMVANDKLMSSATSLSSPGQVYAAV
ncbi:hypothetical protein JDV02_005522 [Purpureocillium takamizusanense]|uniref:Asl1-like glycosyl hydrolase catalytic domain-containing protein n=1 Tax=Purpureocillium takamizusanense TaxID=2060973 RepID=A0A9Q8QHG8_9HYPO|nr:uncharacterized protein JDV02_005522 [Purpureocillium takamizusanense]UNI19332.1 hypothetical protein JDV02_005522 [Purpureocillium takamizusanense]